MIKILTIEREYGSGAAERVRRLQQEGKKNILGSSGPRHFFHFMINSAMGDKSVVQMVLDGLSTIQKGAY